MKSFLSSLKTSAIALTLLTILLGIIYPLFMFGVGQIILHKEAKGSLIYDKGRVIGSELIAQNFTKPEYFHSRPSSAGDKGYDAANSSGSNLGPTSQKLFDAIKKRADDYRKENNLSDESIVPSSAVTASGSGLDPHITTVNARTQAPRVANARGISQDEIDKLIEEHTEGRFLGLLGEERINVLRINLALDKIKPAI